MTMRVAELPQPLADAVRHARSKVEDTHAVAYVAPVIDPAVRAFLRDVVRSGELAEAISEVAKTDPELAS